MKTLHLSTVSLFPFSYAFWSEKESADFCHSFEQLCSCQNIGIKSWFWLCHSANDVAVRAPTLRILSRSPLSSRAEKNLLFIRESAEICDCLRPSNIYCKHILQLDIINNKISNFSPICCPQDPFFSCHISRCIYSHQLLWYGCDLNVLPWLR